MIFTRRFGALAARPTFNDSPAPQAVELAEEPVGARVDTPALEHHTAA